MLAAENTVRTLTPAQNHSRIAGLDDDAETMRGAKQLSAGQIDAGFAALSGFAIGIYAARTLSAAAMGAFGLLFATFGFVSQFSTQLVYAPAQAMAIGVPKGSRPSLFRQTIPAGMAVGVLTALAIPLGILPVVGAVSSKTLIPLTTTAAALAIVSPMQDHVRAMLHLAGRSWRAAWVSIAQAVLVVLLLLVLDTFGEAWAPFGSLAVANAIAISGGIYLGRSAVRRRTPLPRLADFWRIGKSLVVVGAATTAGQFLVALVLEEIQGVEALGAFESARVAARPLQVVGMGLIAVLSPDLMQNAAAGDRSKAQAIRRRYLAWMGFASLAVIAITATPWALNPLFLLVPAAYSVSGLAAAAMAANLMGNASLPLQAEMLGGAQQHRLARIELRVQAIRVVTSFTAIVLGPFAIPLANATAATIKWLCISCNLNKLLYVARTGSASDDFADGSQQYGSIGSLCVSRRVWRSNA